MSSGVHTFLGPQFIWKNAVSLLSNINGDVLQILDCCYAAEAVDQFNCELLLATSATEEASADIETCFTNALLQTLTDINGSPYSVAEIYGHMMRYRHTLNLVYSPIYVPPEPGSSSIVLQKLGPPPVPRPRLISSANKTVEPKAIITAHLDASLTQDNVKELKKWLTKALPSNIQGLEIELTGVFEAESTIVEFRVPIEIWACLREDPAYTYVGMARSGNKLLSWGQSGTLAARPPSGYENIRPGSSK